VTFELQPRHRRYLYWLAASLVVTAIYTYWSPGTPAVVAPVAADSVDTAQKQLTRLRQLAATVPQKEEILKGVQAELDKRESGFLTGDTAAQAQAQLLQILRRLCASSTPPIEIRNVERGTIMPLGDSYGAVNVTIQIDCPIEQVVNLLTSLAAEPELIYTSDLGLSSKNNPREKIVSVRLGVSGVVPRTLVPGKPGEKSKDKKGGTGI
jgi:Type II secretion system (T2SS), protein M subtype b